MPIGSSAISIVGVSDTALNLKALLEGVLARVVANLQEYSVPVPERAYWTMGTPALDCEQIVVWFAQAYLGRPGDQATEPRKCQDPYSAVINISIARPQATPALSGAAPSAEQIQAASDIMAVDAWVLLQTVRSLDLWDGVENQGYGPYLGIIATLEAGAAQGGFNQVTMQVTMGIP